MEINIREDSVEIIGYVNAVERNSKPLASRIGRFVERICKGAFSNALKRSDDVYLLLNHDKGRVLGSTRQGNLELEEDNIGLHARAVITDPEVIMSARNGDLVGWSFGFYDTPDGVENGVDEDTKLPLRKLRDLDLREVSILDKSKTPAYDGTLIMARSEDEVEYYGEPMMEEINVTENMEERYNQNHDPRTGRFATAGGAGGGGGASIWGAEHDQAMEVLSVSAYLKATGTAKTKNENVANMYAQNANPNFDFTVTKDGDGWIITSKAKDNRSLEYDEYDQMIETMKQNRFNPNHD